MRFSRSEVLSVLITEVSVSAGQREYLMPHKANLNGRVVTGLTVSSSVACKTDMNGIAALGYEDLQLCFITLYCRDSRGTWGEWIKDVPLSSLCTDFLSVSGSVQAGAAMSVMEFEGGLNIDFSKSKVRVAAPLSGLADGTLVFTAFYK